MRKCDNMHVLTNFTLRPNKNWEFVWPKKKKIENLTIIFKKRLQIHLLDNDNMIYFYWCTSIKLVKLRLKDIYNECVKQFYINIQSKSFNLLLKIIKIK